MQKKRKTRVRWTDEELDRVVQEALLLAFSETKSVWKYLKDAQERVLPPERRRMITGKGQASERDLRAFFQARDELFVGELPSEIIIRDIHVLKMPVEVALREATDEQLLQALQDRLLQKKSPVDGLVEEIAEHPVIQKVPPTKFLMIGFLKSQVDKVARHVDDLNVEVLHHDSKKGGKTLPECHHYIYMSSKTSHSIYEQVVRAARKRGMRIKYAEGITTANQTIRRIMMEKG